MDLDDFKAVNDLHGHRVGDELLITLSARMKEALREGDTLARIGGDEFVVVLNDLAKAEDCKPILDRLLLAVSEPTTIDEIVLRLTASIGVTLCPQDSLDVNMLLRHADQAMYLAKQAGKNCYHLFNTLNDSAVNTRRESLDNISAALDRGELVLHYQPKVNMATGEIVGVEALIRWQHPINGLVPPLDFLPIIEGHAISLAVGEWVIDTALRQISEWQSMGITFPISVNISAHQLQQADFVTRLAALLTNHPEVSPHSLELEVLETSAVTDINNVSVTMYACRDMGVYFALDDFGTGYSSLTHLRRLPASWIKIDRSFVRDMLTDSDDLSIIKGVISLAKSFQRSVIAEGVETIEHGTELLELGCELAQGYGIAKPMPAGDIPGWMVDWKPDATWRGKEIIQIINKSLNEDLIYQKDGLEMMNIELLKAAVMDSRDGITISDFTKPDNPLIFINPAFETMTGYVLEDVINKNCRYLQGDDRNQSELAIIRSAIKNAQPCVVTLRNYRKDGSMFWNELSLSPIVASNGLASHYLGVQKDVTARVLLEEEIQSDGKGLRSSNTMLEYMVNFDPLTGVYNRRFFDEQINIQWKIAIRNNENIAIYILDIDHLKKFNDSYGHQDGDEALIKVANQLNKSFMKSTDFLARYESARFIILTAEGGKEVVKDYANTIVQRVSDLKIPHEASKTGFLTVSLGYCIISPNINETPQLAIKRADIALYRAKNSGRNIATDFT